LSGSEDTERGGEPKSKTSKNGRGHCTYRQDDAASTSTSTFGVQSGGMLRRAEHAYNLYRFH
jgi:hypothetical protein